MVVRKESGEGCRERELSHNSDTQNSFEFLMVLNVKAVVSLDVQPCFLVYI